MVGAGGLAPGRVDPQEASWVRPRQLTWRQPLVPAPGDWPSSSTYGLVRPKSTAWSSTVGCGPAGSTLEPSEVTRCLEMGYVPRRSQARALRWRIHVGGPALEGPLTGPGRPAAGPLDSNRESGAWPHAGPETAKRHYRCEGGASSVWGRTLRSRGRGVVKPRRRRGVPPLTWGPVRGRRRRLRAPGGDASTGPFHHARPSTSPGYARARRKPRFTIDPPPSLGYPLRLEVGVMIESADRGPLARAPAQYGARGG
jgi:hypothetical protein